MSETPEAPAPTPPQPPSRISRFFRRLLRWAAGLVVLFALGVATTWLVRVRPQAAEIARLRSELATAQAELETLRPLPAQVESLQDELTRLRTALAIQEILVDVTSARFSLALGDAGGATENLARTDSRLTNLASMLPPSRAAQVAPMRERLALALREINGDRFAAMSDLEVLANQLLSLRQSLEAD